MQEILLLNSSKRLRGRYPYKHTMAMREGNTRNGRRPSEYNTWVSMRQRCRDVNDKQYKDYGGRGIKVCPEWEDFVVFYNDMGPRPEGYQLERIDNDGDYCKENCKWASLKDQRNNRRTTRYHYVNGEKIAHVYLLEKHGITRDTWRHREEKKGIDFAYKSLGITDYILPEKGA